MKKIIVVGLLVLAVLLSGCGKGAQPTATPGVQAEYVPVVSVTGELVPETWATLSSKSGGTVAEVLVEPGDTVAAGATLVRMDTTALEISLRIAQQEVAAQQAVLDRLIAGVSDRIVARADRENVQQVTQAEIALKAKQRQLEQARAKNPADDVAVAQVRVRRLELQLTQARAQNPIPEVTVAQVELERTKIALDDTQNEYNKALDRPWEDQEMRDAWAKQLEQAQLNYRSAQAQLDRASNAQRAHAISLEVLTAQLEEGKIALAQTLDAQGAYSITLSVLSAEVEAAQAQLEYLTGWDNPYLDKATDEAIAQARARLQQAEWSVAQTEQQIEDAEVQAPFDGTVGVVDVRVGELVSPGQSLVTVGDLNVLRVETTDLDEIDVVRVSVDQGVSVTFDALPDQVFAGRVARISPMAEPGTGGVHYTVVIELEETDSVLRWGMTAFVDIEVE